MFNTVNYLLLPPLDPDEEPDDREPELDDLDGEE